jgi:hypothetical protein
MLLWQYGDCNCQDCLILSTLMYYDIGLPTNDHDGNPTPFAGEQLFALSQVIDQIVLLLTSIPLESSLLLGRLIQI